MVKKKQKQTKSRPITVKNLRDCLLFIVLSLVSGLLTYISAISVGGCSGECLCATAFFGILTAIFGILTIFLMIAPFAILLSEDDFMEDSK
jgi:ABC-type transport system involved in cytochrome bd biosynthesis fused ATPase/permease subunit